MATLISPENTTATTLKTYFFFNRIKQCPDFVEAINVNDCYNRVGYKIDKRKPVVCITYMEWRAKELAKLLNLKEYYVLMNTDSETHEITVFFTAGDNFDHALEVAVFINPDFPEGVSSWEIFDGVEVLSKRLTRDSEV